MSPRHRNEPLPPLGELVQRLREESGLSYGQLSLRSGLTKSVLFRIENGHSKTAQVETLNALALALNGDVEALYEAAGLLGGPDLLPELPVYFRSKYKLGELDIQKLEAVLKEITKPVSKPKSRPAKSGSAPKKTASKTKKGGQS